MKSFILLLFFCTIFQQCKTTRYFKFQQSKTTSSFQTDPTEDLEDKENFTHDSITYFDGDNVKETLSGLDEIKKPPIINRKRNPDSPSVTPVAPDVLKSDTSYAFLNKSTPRKTNSLARISFYSGLILIIYTLAAFPLPLFGMILLGLLPLTAVVTGKLGLRQIAKRNEGGNYLAIFGITVGALFLFLALAGLIFLGAYKII